MAESEARAVARAYIGGNMARRGSKRKHESSKNNYYNILRFLLKEANDKLL